MIELSLKGWIKYLFVLMLGLTNVSSSDAQQTDVEVRSEESLLTQLETGEHSVGLYEQLGHTYYNQGDRAKARLYYEKALLLSPRDKQIAQSIDYIKEELEVQVTEIPDFILVRWYRNLAQVLSPTVWSIVQLICLALLVFFAYRFLVQKKEVSAGLSRSVWASLLTLLLLTSLLAYKSKQLMKGGDAAILMQGGDMYIAPDDRSESSATFGAGNKVEVLDQIDDWIKVELADKDVGWVQKHVIEKI